MGSLSRFRPRARIRASQWDKCPRQRIRYLAATDGVQLAWAEAGTGPVLVKAANWLTHLEYDWESPVWRHWLQFFSRTTSASSATTSAAAG